MPATILDRTARIERLQRAMRWLRDSGIQAPPNDADAGGVHAWIDLRSGEPSYLYSEITGYFVTLAVQLHRHGGLLGDARGDWLDRARAAADWLVTTAQHESGGILTRKYLKQQSSDDPWSFRGGRVAFFDCAMVGCGLVALYEASNERRWLEAAERLGQYVLRSHEAPDQQERYAAFDVFESHPVAEGERWSQHFGPYELKSAYFLGGLGRVSSNPAYHEFLDRILEQAIAGQLPEGRFATHPRALSTHLHPHCYTLEGLFYMMAARGRRELMPRVVRAIDWMFQSCLLREPPLQQWADREDRRIEGTRADALAQALRAYEIAKAFDPGLSFAWEGRVSSLYERVNGFETASGGTVYGADEAGNKQHHENAWVHFFRMEMDLFGVLRQAGELELDETFLLT